MGEADSHQAKVLDFLGRPQAYAPLPATVERIETHASIVFLAGAFAYKVKRAVKYNFLDFSTLEKRRAACLNELRVNARTAPQLYLEVVPVTIGKTARSASAATGEAVEWVLTMRRFDQAKLYDRMAGEGRLGLASMPRLAEIIAAFHDSADRVLSADQAVRPLEGVLARQCRDLCRPPRDLSAAKRRGRSPQASRERLAALAPLLAARARGGYVRHCHGDLHLRNIVEIDGAPVLFDAIEFDDRLATIDVLYDLAFLLDGSRQARAQCLTPTPCSTPISMPRRAPAISSDLRRCRCSSPCGRRSGPRSSCCARAGGARSGERRARGGPRLFRSGAEFPRAPPRPRLIAIGGLSGSGKSAVARAIAPHVGAFPGRGACAKRRRAEALVRRGSAAKGCRPRPIRPRSRSRSTPCAASAR